MSIRMVIFTGHSIRRAAMLDRLLHWLVTMEAISYSTRTVSIVKIIRMLVYSNVWTYKNSLSDTYQAKEKSTTSLQLCYFNNFKYLIKQSSAWHLHVAIGGICAFVVAIQGTLYKEVKNQIWIDSEITFWMNGYKESRSLNCLRKTFLLFHRKQTMQSCCRILFTIRLYFSSSARKISIFERSNLIIWKICTTQNFDMGFH